MAGVGRLLLLTPLPGCARLPVGHPARAASLRHQGPRRSHAGLRCQVVEAEAVGCRRQSVIRNGPSRNARRPVLRCVMARSGFPYGHSRPVGRPVCRLVSPASAVHVRRPCAGVSAGLPASVAAAVALRGPASGHEQCAGQYQGGCGSDVSHCSLWLLSAAKLAKVGGTGK